MQQPEWNLEGVGKCRKLGQSILPGKILFFTLVGVSAAMWMQILNGGNNLQHKMRVKYYEDSLVAIFGSLDDGSNEIRILGPA